MTVRDFATFETDLEPLEPPATDASVPPGRVVATRLVSRLRDAGVDVSHEVTPWESYAWEFGVRSANATVSCVLQASDTWLVITRPVRSFADRFRGRTFADEHQAVCLAVDKALTSDPAIRNVRWFTRAEFERTATS
jgi:hypothetical protein